MKLKSFLKLVEIQTKVASVIPFLLGLVYTLYNYGSINVLNMVVMFFAMLIFDMSVTALNNYFDYKRAVKKHGYNYEVHNSVVQFGLKESVVLTTIIIMLIVFAALGLYLVYLTDIIVLILGAICFAVGVIYSYGPIPISRTPFGEIFSGVTMGLLIPFITIYINIMDTGILIFELERFVLTVGMDLLSILGIVVVTLPAVLCIANIMLANNICDVEDDFENKRYTLPILVGRPRAILLLKVLYYASYVAIIAGVCMGVLPLYSLLVLVTLIPVRKKIGLFVANPSKRDTFGQIVACFVIICVPLILTIGIGIAVNAIF